MILNSLSFTYQSNAPDKFFTLTKMSAWDFQNEIDSTSSI